ncbi:MAG: hypothetical protein AMXMBFR64_39530 [Myxococcales bacterium]
MPLDWITEAARVLKRGAALITFVDAFAITTVRDALRDVGLRPLRPLYWVKSGPPHCPRANFTNGVEVAVFARKPGRVLHWPMNSRGGYAGTISNVWTGSTDARSSIRSTGHPTQKPEALMRWLADIVCPSDGIVLDPYCGSGTTGIGVLGTGVEAATTGRRFFGIEQDPTECQVARERLLGLAGAVAGARAREGVDENGNTDDVFALLDHLDG